MTRHDAEDIAFGTSPLDDAPEGLVGRIVDAFNGRADAEREEGYNEGHAIGLEDGESAGRDTGRDDERESIVDFLYANGYSEAANTIRDEDHHGKRA